ncbi:hypothetical protein CYMTET_53619 [Cymbomonas tetramitiformis]|uniref:F-box domain-containing protein n=1 Tax=Cymbomonas tetramitiformis TaxID=36881 RepID=A0AAE0EQE6_9CHLO|nr:hypothetical protein CYMTET_53619 [Cymbomonas tetramitiformis]
MLHLPALPREVLIQVLARLGARDICRITCVNNFFRELCSSAEVWETATIDNEKNSQLLSDWLRGRLRNLEPRTLQLNSRKLTEVEVPSDTLRSLHLLGSTNLLSLSLSSPVLAEVELEDCYSLQSLSVSSETAEKGVNCLDIETIGCNETLRELDLRIPVKELDLSSCWDLRDIRVHSPQLTSLSLMPNFQLRCLRTLDLNAPLGDTLNLRCCGLLSFLSVASAQLQNLFLPGTGEVQEVSLNLPSLQWCTTDTDVRGDNPPLADLAGCWAYTNLRRIHLSSEIAQVALPGFLESLVDVSLELPNVSELSVYQHCAENLHVTCRGLRALKLTGCHDLIPAQLSTVLENSPSLEELEIKGLRNVRELTVRHSKIRDLQFNLSKLNTIQDFTVACPQLISVEWPVTTSLTSLDLHVGLHRIDLSFTGPKPTALMQTLRILRVHGPAARELVLRKWQGAQIESLCVQCKQLEELDLSHLERLTHLDLVEMDRLQWLYLPTFGQLRRVSVHAAQLKHLTWYNLHSLAASSRIVCKNLVSLELRSDMLSETLKSGDSLVSYDSLIEAPSLKHLHVSAMHAEELVQVAHAFPSITHLSLLANGREELLECEALLISASNQMSSGHTFHPAVLQEKHLIELKRCCPDLTCFECASYLLHSIPRPLSSASPRSWLFVLRCLLGKRDRLQVNSLLTGTQYAQVSDKMLARIHQVGRASAACFAVSVVLLVVRKFVKGRNRYAAENLE